MKTLKEMATGGWNRLTGFRRQKVDVKDLEQRAENGRQVQSLVQTPGWQLLEKELKGRKESLLNKIMYQNPQEEGAHAVLQESRARAVEIDLILLDKLLQRQLLSLCLALLHGPFDFPQSTDLWVILQRKPVGFRVLTIRVQLGDLLI